LVFCVANGFNSAKKQSSSPRVVHTFNTYTSVKEVVGYFIEMKTPEAYYSDGQEFTGFWVGKAASLLGLQGRVDSESFERLCGNRHPLTGEKLKRIMRDGMRIAQDHTFGPPKSVSLAYAYTGDERLIEAVRSAGATAMAAAEKLMATRVRKKGQDFDRITGNLVASEHIHLTTRPVDGFPDPHVHVHYVLFNVTFDPVEKEWKAAQMPDEPGLGFEGLPHIGVERLLGDVTEDLHFRVGVALAQDAALALLDIGGTPRGVEVMQGNQALLDIGPRAHLLRAAKEDADLTGANVAEQLQLGVVALVVLNELDF
jgi:hypothetical protein